LARSIDVGLSQLQRAQGDLRSQLLERVLLEVQRSLDHFDRQFSSLSVSKLVLAPLRDDAGLQTQLREGLYIEVEEACLANCLDLSRVPELASQKMQAEQLLTIGAALREEISQ